MKNAPFLLVFIIFIASCKKEESIVEEVDSKYDIAVIGLDTIITYPQYSWDSKNYKIDLDEDGKPDMNFTLVYHSFYTDFGTFIGHSYIYVSELNRVNLDYSFSTYTDTTNYILFETGDSIPSHSNWSNAQTIYFMQHEYVSSGQIINNLKNPFNKKNNTGFIAIRKTIDENTFYGWAKISHEPNVSLSIYECAFNRIPNVPIAIGQKE